MHVGTPAQGNAKALRSALSGRMDFRGKLASQNDLPREEGYPSKLNVEGSNPFARS